MLISTQTEYCVIKFGYEKGIRLLCEAGFDCLDLSMFNFINDPDCPLLGDDYVQFAQRIKNIAAEYSVTFNQCHAPFGYNQRAFFENSSSHDKTLFILCRSIDIAGILGARAIVIHPVHYMDYNSCNRDEILDLNMKFYGELAPFAIKCGVKIAVENMWQYDKSRKIISEDVCSNPYDHARYVDALNREYGCFVACLDIGHCALTGYRADECVRILGNERLYALHVHDNDFKDDLHTLPLTASIKFLPILQALKEIGYKGEFTLESDGFLQRYEPSFYPYAVNYMKNTCDYLLGLVENEEI